MISWVESKFQNEYKRHKTIWRKEKFNLNLKSVTGNQKNYIPHLKKNTLAKSFKEKAML